MIPRYHSPFLLLILIVQLCSCDNAVFGGTYLFSPKVTGLDTYLGCGDDNKCSILDISNAQLHDGWTAHDLGSGHWGWRIRFDSWALDVDFSGSYGAIFANPTIYDANTPLQINGQLWGLFTWTSDSTALLYNEGWKQTLDVKDNVTPFINEKQEDDLSGQHWYLRSVAPQVTSTTTVTSTSTVNEVATSTTTTTITTCLGKRDEAYPLLQKRGAEILSTTTQTETDTVTVTVTETDSTKILTSTDTVFSCAPTTVAVTQPANTIVSVYTLTPVPGATVTSTASPSPPDSTPTSSEAPQNPTSTSPGNQNPTSTSPGNQTPTSTLVPTVPGVSVSTVSVFTAAPTATSSPPPSGATKPVQTAMMGWVVVFWLFVGFWEMP